MAYQTRLDQLESDVFQTGNTASRLSIAPLLPYAVICGVLLVGLYASCPALLKTTPPRTKANRNPVAQLQLQRFLLAWVVLCLAVGLL